ncbi:MAG TPA: hypothetical protein VNO74_08815, partial [Methylomirabilota bacterium]|nr:hypothetical protein [Methylomirabilota bacterium]
MAPDWLEGSIESRLSDNRGPAAVIIQAETIKQAETNKTMLLEFAYDNRFERADTLAIGGHS